LNYKIAIVISHPVQHFCPMYASWAKINGISLKVFFASNLGSAKYFDTNFKKEISWSNLYLDEFNHEFLNGDKTLLSIPELDAENLDAKLNEFQPQLLVHYGYFHKIAKRARHWAILNKVKIAYISDAEHKQARPLWKEIVKIPYLFFYFKKVDFFFTVGDANEAYYKFYGVPQCKLHRMMFSIDIKSYDVAFSNKEELKKQFRSKFNIGTNEIALAVVGKLVSWKSQDDLIKLLYKLEKEVPQKKFHLFIVGSGEMEASWKTLAKNLVHNKAYFLGFVNPTSLPEIYAATDVYIHPAKVEPHSLSISEAIYMGCPIIVANTSGSWGNNDDVQHNKNGYIYAHGNIEELQQCLLKTIHDKLPEFSSFSITISRKFQQLSHGKMLQQILKIK
jgi:glycosyltransferase involved in cell wall biosynthesis